MVSYNLSAMLDIRKERRLSTPEHEGCIARHGITRILSVWVSCIRRDSSPISTDKTCTAVSYLSLSFSVMVVTLRPFNETSLFPFHFI